MTEMKPSWDESYLRFRVRSEWIGAEPIWVEHGRGGTEGAPDCFLPLGSAKGYLPVELKKWAMVGDRIAFEARPSQRRFHLLTARSGQRSAFLALLPDLSVVALSGAFLPAIPLPAFPPRVRVVQYRISALAGMLNDETFWNGG